MLFADFSGFTALAESMEPSGLIHQLDAYFSGFDEIIERHGLEKIKSIGDGYTGIQDHPWATAVQRNARQLTVNHTSYHTFSASAWPHSGRRCASSKEWLRARTTNWSLLMLLPFDLRADREGWTVFEIETDRPASIDDVRLTGLSLDDAEDAVNALNKLEIALSFGTRSRAC